MIVVFVYLIMCSINNNYYCYDVHLFSQSFKFSSRLVCFLTNRFLFRNSFRKNLYQPGILLIYPSYYEMTIFNLKIS